MNDNNSNLFNLTESSYHNRQSLVNTSTNYSNSSVLDNDFEDISKDIDERVTTIRNKIINDLIKRRLFDTKQRQIEELTIDLKNPKTKEKEDEANIEDILEENVDDREIKDLEEKLEELDNMIAFVQDKKHAFEEMKDKNEQMMRDEALKYKTKADELENALQNDLLPTLEDKKSTLNNKNIEKDVFLKSAQLKSHLISSLLQLQIITESYDRVRFVFENKYHIILQKKLETWKLIEWEPRNKIYTMPLYERRQIEESFQKMDMKSWIINIRDLLLQ